MPDCFCLCAVLLGLLILTLAGCIFYSGLLADITVKTCCPAFNKLTFAYKFKEGAYKDSGELLKEARCIGLGLGLPCLGVFYEDPKKERRLCAHPFLELYRDGQIQFIVPLARQGDFYVPEVRQTERRLSEQEEFHSDTDVSGTLSLLCCAALAQTDMASHSCCRLLHIQYLKLLFLQNPNDTSWICRTLLQSSRSLVEII
uniref:Testis expressed 264, ER-phagy receptor n=1 Tax=Poecilia reticulata TaxID=8081 RepID=A0A3P9N777_POERE